MKKPRIIIDIGGVIFPEMDKAGQKWGTPYPFAIKAVNDLFDEGRYEVILWTSRYNDEHHQNPYNDYSNGYVETMSLLEKAGLKFHQLWMGKPKYLAWIDNRAIKVNADKDGKSAWDKGLKELQNRFDRFIQESKDDQETQDSLGSEKDNNQYFVIQGPTL